MKIHPVSTMRPVHLVGRLVKHEEELGELKMKNTFSHQFSMVGGTNCTLHNDNQVTQGQGPKPKRIVDARYYVGSAEPTHLQPTGHPGFLLCAPPPGSGRRLSYWRTLPDLGPTRRRTRMMTPHVRAAAGSPLRGHCPSQLRATSAVHSRHSIERRLAQLVLYYSHVRVPTLPSSPLLALTPRGPELCRAQQLTAGAGARSTVHGALLGPWWRVYSGVLQTAPRCANLAGGCAAAYHPTRAPYAAPRGLHTSPRGLHTVPVRNASSLACSAPSSPRTDITSPRTNPHPPPPPRPAAFAAAIRSP
eukprot:scaffold11050_cov116-Isochrysis_galbana.AAC.1